MKNPNSGYCWKWVILLLSWTFQNFSNVLQQVSIFSGIKKKIVCFSKFKEWCHVRWWIKYKIKIKKSSCKLVTQETSLRYFISPSLSKIIRGPHPPDHFRGNFSRGSWENSNIYLLPFPPQCKLQANFIRFLIFFCCDIPLNSVFQRHSFDTLQVHVSGGMEIFLKVEETQRAMMGLCRKETVLVMGFTQMLGKCLLKHLPKCFSNYPKIHPSGQTHTWHFPFFHLPP